MLADHDSRLSGFEPTTFQLPCDQPSYDLSDVRVIMWLTFIWESEMSKRGMDTVLLCFCSDVPHLDFQQAWGPVGGACVRRMMSSLSMLPPAAVTSLMHSTDPPPLSSVLLQLRPSRFQRDGGSSCAVEVQLTQSHNPTQTSQLQIVCVLNSWCDVVHI